MKYILLGMDGQVAEIIPEFNPSLPGFPLKSRYSSDFISKLLPVEDEVEVEQNWVYDPETNTFTPPPVYIEAQEENSEATEIEDAKKEEE